MSKPNNSMRSPLGRVRGLGSAKSGTHHWWMQRVTAVAMIPLVLYPLVALVCHAICGGYSDIVQWMQSPFSAGGIVLFLLVAFYHAAMGLQVVIEDYVHCETSKLASLLIIKFLCAASAIVGTLATLKIYFGVH